MVKVLVTGAAGFVGAHFSLRLADSGYDVVGLDNLNDYYDVQLKRDRLTRLIGRHANFRFRELDMADRVGIEALFEAEGFDYVVNLGAQAGVRYSLANPHAYIQSNLVGFTNVLEGCRHAGVKHLIFASSSSVYGANQRMPFSVDQTVDHPVSLYAATKKSNEMLAHAYASLYAIPTTGLRFFTVYGPWGRPDMAYFSFTRAILAGATIDIYNQGDMARDFTYIDDVIEGMVRLLEVRPEPDPDWDGADPTLGRSYAPYRLYNIGNHRPVRLLDFVRLLEDLLGKQASKRFLPMQAGDVQATYADVEGLRQAVDYRPDTPIETGLKRFVDWYLNYYRGREAAGPSSTNF